MKIPTFETPRLLLRELVASDIPAYERHFVDYEVIRTLAVYVPWPYPDGGVSEYLETYVFPAQGITRWAWAIALKDSPGELIGAVELWREGKPEHRGFWLGKNFWGKGYMTEAVEPTIDFAFEQLAFDKLIFTNASGNRRSARVKEKTGARLTGVGPDSFVDPSLTEREFYELSRSDWETFKGQRR